MFRALQVGEASHPLQGQSVCDSSSLLFFALNLIFRHRVMSRGKFLFSRQVVEVDDLNYSFSFGSLPADSTVASFGSDASI
jgi:hypothetical protein